MVVETMKKEHLSIYAAMQEFGINDHKIIERWERIYLEEGPEGLATGSPVAFCVSYALSSGWAKCRYFIFAR